MIRLLGVIVLLFGLSSLAMAEDDESDGRRTVAAPEIDAASAAGALALLSGCVLIIRSRRKQTKPRS
jgi:hypothetical protein